MYFLLVVKGLICMLNFCFIELLILNLLLFSFVKEGYWNQKFNLLWDFGQILNKPFSYKRRFSTNTSLFEYFRKLNQWQIKKFKTPWNFNHFIDFDGFVRVGSITSIFRKNQSPAKFCKKPVFRIWVNWI